MKVFACLIAALGIFASSASAQVPVPITNRNVRIEKITPAVISTPDFNFQLTTPKRTEFLKWLEIEVEFGVDGVDLVDELTMSYVVGINGKLCVGEVTHVNIPKGKDRFSVMYISPRNLDRLTGGKQLNNSMIDNVWITLSRQGQTLAEKAVQPRPIPNLPRLNDMLSSKSETPFHVLWWDRYEAVRPKR